MNIEYYKEQICDELEGAVAYIKKAIECKPTNPAWAQSFQEMSVAELDHATKLYNMFEDEFKKISEQYQEVPEYITDTRICIIDEYTETTAKVRYMQDMFNR